MLDRDCQVFLLTTVIVNLALNPGSSKQGKAFLASVGWNCVVARYLNSEKMSKNIPRIFRIIVSVYHILLFCIVSMKLACLNISLA